MGAFTPVVDAGGAESKLPESRVLVIITGGRTPACIASAPHDLASHGGADHPYRYGMEKRDEDQAWRNRHDANPKPAVPLSAIKDGARITIDSLRTPPSSYSKHIRYGALEFSPLLDSSSISSAGWAQIADAIKANYHLFDGFVVLHGTDSLAYSASALSFMLEDLGKPVILTGSQASIFALQSDAVDNLLGSLIVAGTFVIPEVCLFFHHTLFRGNRTTKVSASSFEAFASPNCDPLARVTGLGIDVNWQLVRRPTRLARFVDARTTHLDTAHVACVRVFPGIKPRMVDSVLRVPNLRGLIIETFGMGNAPSVSSSSSSGTASPAAEGGEEESLPSVIRAAVERGVTVVNVSQCAHGLVSPLYAPGFALGAAGVVFGHDLTSEAALTKLSYLLAADPPLAQAEVAELMARDLRGEMTERRVPSFTHPAARSLSFSLGPAAAAGEPGGSLLGAGGRRRNPISDADAAFTALGWAIRDADVDAVRDMLEGDEVSYQLLKRADYAGNTAVHLAALAAGPDPRQQQQGDGAAASTQSGHSAADVLKELLVRGASVHARNRANNTPLFLAQQAGNAECVALLKEAGAVLWEDEVSAAKEVGE
ncbi:hypothetical protein DL765_007614 [Monosporascus sp. GIB2]|nr:hypothetical protein DL765_007614 [Monosporascus sp. GIB2]